MTGEDVWFEPRDRGVVEARQVVDADAAHDIAVWCDGRTFGPVVGADGPFVGVIIDWGTVPGSHGQIARKNDWVVKTPAGWVTMTRTVFDMKYRPVPACICPTPGTPDYDGPDAACDVHGQPSVAYDQGFRDGDLMAALRAAADNHPPETPDAPT